MQSSKEKKMFTTRDVFTGGYWREAALQLKDVRVLCVAAMLIALRIALKGTKIPVGQDLNITFGFFVNSLGAMIFGPVMAVIGAVISDTLGVLVDPSGGAYFFPFVFVEIAGSLIFALMLWRQKLTSTRIILSRFFVVAACNYVLNPAILNWYYLRLNNGKSSKFITLPRVVKNLALFPAESFLLILFLSAMVLPLTKLGLIPAGQEKFTFTKKNAVLLSVLFVLSALFVGLYYFVYLPNK